METDSILYIVITLVILIVSGLSGRRKKQAQMREAEFIARQRDNKDPSEEADFYEPEAYEREFEPAPANIFESMKSTGSSILQSSNPFERMEQILSGQDYRIQGMEEETFGESPEETLEATADEEEKILADIQNRNDESITDYFETDAGSDSSIGIQKEAPPISALFSNVDEIKKAVIYSEILNRKY